MNQNEEKYSCISPNGFTVNFDTQKRRVYTDETEGKIVSLKFGGMSIRKIAKELSIPPGSIPYILKKHGCTSGSQQKPGLNWIDRAEARMQFDMNNAQFDYVKLAYPQYYKNINGKAFIHVYYGYDYIEMHKGYSDSERKKRETKRRNSNN